MAEPTDPAQPFLPRIGLVWFFIVAALVAVAMGIIRAADQGATLAAALVFVGVYAVALTLLSAVFFLVAFLFGATEKAVGGRREEVASPFSDGSPPQQIIPPRTVDES